ncbi:MAG: FG-GAP-like repeat-containing protein [Gemmatimonadota bacterium]
MRAWSRLPRRKRLLAISGVLTALFLAAVIGGLRLLRAPAAPYRPGEDVEGLTSELARSLPEDYPRVTFQDVSEAAGIRFRHFSGRRSNQLPEDMGSGAAWGDYDGDGWLDLFVVNEVGPLTLGPAQAKSSPARSTLYHNEGDGRFTDVTEAVGIDLRGWGMAAAWTDYDNDGHPDLAITSYGGITLLHNEGDGRFTDRTAKAGLSGPRGFWTGAAWADYDRDGLADLYVTAYVKYETLDGGATSRQYDVEVPPSLNPESFEPERNLLFHNLGGGRFTEVAGRAGVSDPEGRSLSAAWADFDQDGWPDLYVANDVSDNALYRNRGDGTFEDVSHLTRVADYRGAMGLAVGDWNGDSDLDLFVTHWIAQENAFYDNRLRSAFESLEAPAPNTLQFMDEADRYGLGQIALDFVGWGTSFFDYDNDGRVDLLVVNGSTFQEAEHPERLIPMSDQLFWNRGPEEGFYDLSPVAGEYFSRQYVGRGAAFGDYDNDGAVDVFIVNNGGPGVLLRNSGAPGRHWLELRLRGTRSNRSALGARVDLLSGGSVQTREVGVQSSYLSQNSPVVHFGLGARAAVDSLVIRWPSGLRQVVPAPPTDRILEIAEGRPARVASGVGGGRSADSAGSSVSSRGSLEARERTRRFWQRYREASRARIAGDLETAAREYAAALTLDSTHEDALYYLGNVELERGDFRAAAEAWERLEALDPGSARVHFQLGRLHACPSHPEGLDLERAEREFRRAREINSEETGPLLRLGQVALLRGDLEEATEELDAVTSVNEQSVDALYLKGYIAWKRGRNTESIALFRKAIDGARSVVTARPPAGGAERADSVRRAARGRGPCGALDVDRAALAAVDKANVESAAMQSYRNLDAELMRVRRGTRRVRPGGGPR